MMTSSIRSSLMRVAAPVVLAATLLLPTSLMATTGTVHAAPTHSQSTALKWITYSAATKTAHLTLISAYGVDSYNFNGGTKGKFVVKVPVGTKVVVTYANMSAIMPHGAEIVRWTGSLPTGVAPPPAFAGAASPNYRRGTPKGITQTFTFTAGKAGKYLIICPVKNHVKFGHWAWLIVSKTATKATAVVNA